MENETIKNTSKDHFTDEDNCVYLSIAFKKNENNCCGWLRYSHVELSHKKIVMDNNVSKKVTSMSSRLTHNTRKSPKTKSVILFYGINYDEPIHYEEERSASTDRYDHFSIPMFQPQLEKTLKYFKINSKGSSFNSNMKRFGIPFTFNNNEYYCSQLVKKALIFGGVLEGDHNSSNHISVNGLYYLLKNAKLLLPGSSAYMERRIRVNNVADIV